MELRPCPFCGGDAEVTEIDGRRGRFVFVKCSFCRAQGTTFSEEKDPERAIRRAMDAWNRRDAE